MRVVLKLSKFCRNFVRLKGKWIIVREQFPISFTQTRNISWRMLHFRIQAARNQWKREKIKQKKRPNLKTQCGHICWRTYYSRLQHACLTRKSSYVHAHTLREQILCFFYLPVNLACSDLDKVILWKKFQKRKEFIVEMTLKVSAYRSYVSLCGCFFFFYNFFFFLQFLLFLVKEIPKVRTS